MNIESQIRGMLASGALDLPYAGYGETSLRHQRLVEIGRQNLDVARLAEGHVDAVAILHEAGRVVRPGTMYGVWASEIPGRSLRLSGDGRSWSVSGVKMFCTGSTVIDRALLTVTEPEPRLVEIEELRARRNDIEFDGESEWRTDAFASTHTATASFHGLRICSADFVGELGWYLSRAGFWHGAHGPAACWAGGALGLLDWAQTHTCNDNPHSLAHLGAMGAIGWELRSVLETAGREIDADPDNVEAAMRRALMVRHLVESACTEMLTRFGRALGPRPLAFDEAMATRCQELTLYIRQSHAECDLEKLGRMAITRLGARARTFQELKGGQN